MSDTLANDWRQRMAGRSALCAVLLAVPVAVAAQISFSAGLDNVPFGVSTLAAGPGTTSIGPAGSVAPNQNLSTLLDDTPGTGAASAAAAAAAGGPVDGAPAPSGTGDISGGGAIVPGPGGGGETPGGPGGGGETPGGPGGTPGPTPPTPPTTPEPPAPPPAQPVPGVTVPDVGSVVDSVTAPIDQATGLLPGGGR